MFINVETENNHNLNIKIATLIKNLKLLKIIIFLTKIIKNL